MEPTRTPEPIPADYNVSVSGPPSNEFIKFAQWDDNRVKLSTWVAGYIVAHGLDYPARLVEMDPEGYKDALPHADIDVVFEADPAWAQPYVDAGVIVLLGPLSSASPDTVVAVNSRVWQEAPEVGKFLEQYAWDGDVLTAETSKIRGGRVAIGANVIGLTIFKKMEDLWTPWLGPSEVEAVWVELSARTTGLCREWEIRLGDAFRVRYCKDDPSLVSGD